jgi:hypothetical protein
MDQEGAHFKYFLTDSDWQLYVEPKKMKTVWLWAWRASPEYDWETYFKPLTEAEVERKNGIHRGEYIKCGASFEVPE